VIATINTAAFQGLLAQIEVNAHRRGWDSPPGFYVIYDATDVETDAAYRQVLPPQSRTGEWPIRRLPYIARMAFRPALLEPLPSHALFRMALNVSAGHAKSDLFLGVLGQPGLVGLAVQMEAWALLGGSEAEGRQAGVRLADMPDSKEFRVVHGVDATGSHHMAWRIRGEKPEVGVPAHIGGAVTESLAAIMAALVGAPVPELTCEPSGWDWDAQEYRTPGETDSDVIALWCPIHEHYNLIRTAEKLPRCTCTDPDVLQVNIPVPGPGPGPT
jgi:hypothetical protein